MLLKPIYVYGIQFWGYAGKPTNIKRIQTYESKTLRQITKVLYYVLNQPSTMTYPYPLLLMYQNTL